MLIGKSLHISWEELACKDGKRLCRECGRLEVNNRRRNQKLKRLI